MLSFETFPLRLDNPTLALPSVLDPLLLKRFGAALVLWSTLQPSVMTIKGRPHRSTAGTFIGSVTKKGIIAEGQKANKNEFIFKPILPLLTAYRSTMCFSVSICSRKGRFSCKPGSGFLLNYNKQCSSKSLTEKEQGQM